MAATVKQPIRGSRKDMVTALNDFAKEDKLFYAAEAFLKDALGIIVRYNSVDYTDNNYLKNHGYNTQNVKKALENIESIKRLGFIARETLKKRKNTADDDQNIIDRYDQILVFACEARDGITRRDIAALTLAFNRLHASNDKTYNTTNRPVIILVRQGKKLSISTCERKSKSPSQDYIGEAIVLHDIDCENIKKGHLQILEGMTKKIQKCSTYEELFENLLKSLSIDIVSDNFFAGYTKLFKEIVKTVSENKKISKEFRRFTDSKKAIRNYVKKLMGRIVFVQFLQRKGWMGARDEGWTDGDPEFLQNLFEGSDRKEAFIEEILNPLFNDLNTKRDGDLASGELGREGIKVPYLNGGLFDKDEYDGVKFWLPQDMMGKMLEFFRSYNFTIDENDEESVEVGVDPEMLSRIFESLLEDNKATGSFYTPKEIVTYMCREALTNYLQSETKDESKKAAYRSFVKEHNVDVLDPADLDYVEKKLKTVKICDPAIGSGAFPMGMLKELLDCRRAIQKHRSGGECDSLEIKKEILQNSIYGVDIDKGAVDIARLRFWLALIIDEKTPHALPNMDFKIMQGNSLLEQYEGVDLSRIASLNKRKKSLAGQLSLDVDDKSAVSNIWEAIRVYYGADSLEKKTALREQINGYVTDYIRHAKGLTPEIKKKIKTLPIPNDKFFLWHIYFKEVFDEGGFDIVIGNPPYIELQKLPQKGKLYHKCTFETYSRSADIYCLFTEQGFNLLRKGGTLCYIMMNKWMKAEYGRSLRRYLLERKIHSIVDFGDVQVFKKATTYPCIVLLENARHSSTFKACRLKKFDLDSVNSLYEVFKTKEFDEDIWVTSSRKDLDLFKRLKDGFPELHNYLNVPAKYGIKPGLSKAFLISKETKDKIIKKDRSAEEVISPFYSGKDIRPYEETQPSKYLILFKKGDTLKLMEKDQATEDEAWSFLQSRYPSVCSWLRPFKAKAKNRSDKGDFWWELRACTYYEQFEGVKIMYQTFQVKPNFIYDTKGSYCNNSMWIMATEDKALLGLLNSRLGWWLISNYCSQIQSGYQLIWDYFGRIPVALKKDGVKESEVALLVDRVLSEKLAGNDTTELERKIDGYMYEIYGLTNDDVKVIDPDAQTFGGDFELFERKEDFSRLPDDDLEKVYLELRARFNKLIYALEINSEAVTTGSYDFTSTEQPSKEELEDAFTQWNCAILTAYRGTNKEGEEEEKKNQVRNERRNDELKKTMLEQGLLFRPVDGYYEEILPDGSEMKSKRVNEFSFFVVNTDGEGTRLDASNDNEKAFFMKIYRLAEHYEQESFLFTFPGQNRVAFLVATNKYGRKKFRNYVQFAGPLYENVEELSMWTGCSQDGRIAFKLNGMSQKPVLGTRHMWIGEGDLFDIKHYNPDPDCLLVIHDGDTEELNEKCSSYQNETVPLYETIVKSEDDLRTIVSNELKKLPPRTKVVGFHSSVSINGSYKEGAKVAFDDVRDWVATRRQLVKIVIVDMFGDYYKIQD